MTTNVAFAAGILALSAATFDPGVIAIGFGLALNLVKVGRLAGRLEQQLADISRRLDSLEREVEALATEER